jgi:hypothetical protein
MMMLLAMPGPWTLVMDRTNWQFGSIERNYLVLAVVCHGNAIPLLVKDLAPAGNSDTADRIALVERFLALFGRDRVFCLLADREFVGEEWLKWLIAHQIPSCIRMRNNTLVSHPNGGKVPVQTLLRGLSVGQHRSWDEKLYGLTFRLTGCKFRVLNASSMHSTPPSPLTEIPLTTHCSSKFILWLTLVSGSEAMSISRMDQRRCGYPNRPWPNPSPRYTRRTSAFATISSGVPSIIILPSWRI